jgi:hypothetical protein
MIASDVARIGQLEDRGQRRRSLARSLGHGALEANESLARPFIDPLIHPRPQHRKWQGTFGENGVVKCADVEV